MQKYREVMTEARKPREADYKWGKTLGEGAYGDVILATEIATGTQFAIKKMLRAHLEAKESTRKIVMNERNVLSLCDHPNIVHLHKAFRDADYFYYVLDFATNGDLHCQILKLGALHMDCVKFWTREIVCALEYLHCTVGCIHCDLKPENILLDSQFHVLLTDFGTSKIVDKAEGKLARKGSFVGTVDFMAPELVESSQTCFASDLWSLGCLVYQLLCGRPPFRLCTEYLTMKKLQGGLSSVAFPTPFSPTARSLIESLLQLDPRARLGCDDFAALKAHPFFEGVSETKQPPEPRASSENFVWEEDVLREEKEREKMEKAKLRERW